MNLESVLNFGDLQFYMNRVRWSIVTCSLPNSKLCRGVDVSVLVDMPAVITRDHGAGSREYESFSSRSASCSTARNMRWPKHSFQLQSGFI